MRVSDAVCTEFNDEANGGQKEIEGAMGGWGGGRSREGTGRGVGMGAWEEKEQRGVDG